MKKYTLFSVFLGTLIEVYDFTIFPLMIPILSEVLFPSVDREIAISFTALAYFVSYIIKPLGSIGFGYLMDRLGRKNILILSTLCMTLATSAIGLLPVQVMTMCCGAALILCRVIQGLSISG